MALQKSYVQRAGIGAVKAIRALLDGSSSSADHCAMHLIRVVLGFELVAWSFLVVPIIFVGSHMTCAKVLW
jgi:hypothetical protein